MRIISGTAKGRKLHPPPPRDKSIRPTSDRAREALFSILGDRVGDARVLDLFAGTGAFGLEALSRGARSVVFVDNNRLALELIRKNIQLVTTGAAEAARAWIVKHDLTRSLPIGKFPAETESGFDLIFADPPYSKKISLSVLDFLDQSSLLTRGGQLIVEERYNEELPSQLLTLRCIDKRTYGESVFYLYRPVNSA